MDAESLFVTLQGHASSPFLIAGAIVLATFVLEDAASVAAALLVAAGVIAPGVALAALFIGIVLGDLGLYGLGRIATRNRFARNLLRRRGAMEVRDWMHQRLFATVFSARFLPGARLPTYTASGFLGLPFAPFALAASVASLLWTSAIFLVIYVFGALVWEQLGPWRWAVVILLLAGTIAFPRLWSRTGRGWQRG